MSRQIIVAIVIVYLVSTTPAFAGTFRDDFENEQDFLKDKQLREGGVWGEDISRFVWEDGTIKGTPSGQTFWLLITGNYGWEDYTVECKVKPLEELGEMGLVVRRTCIDCNPCYTMALDFSPSQMAIAKDFGSILSEAPFSPEVDRWYSLKAVAEGKHLDFYLDGELVVEAEDAVYPKGKAGIYIHQTTALFDDFVMTGTEVEDGGHWDPAKHPEEKAVKPKGNLVTTWGILKEKL